MARFLRFTVERALAGKAGELKEYLIGVEVFDRKSSYDPRVDPIVRVEARRLRSKLKAYYEGDGKSDATLIEFLSGSYAPRLTVRTAAAPERQAAEGITVAVLPFADLGLKPRSAKCRACGWWRGTPRRNCATVRTTCARCAIISRWMRC